MSWSIGYDEKWMRDVGYGVPSICDHPECNAEIDRVAIVFWNDQKCEKPEIG